MTDFSDPGTAAAEHAASAKTELTAPFTGRYRANLVTEYEIPVIAITYQAHYLSKPVEVAHAYVRLRQNETNPFAHAELVSDIERNFAASIQHGLRELPEDQPPLYVYAINGFPNEDIRTLMIGAPLSGEVAAKAPNFFAYAQVYFPATRDTAQLDNPRMDGYAPAIVIEAMTTLFETGLRSEYDYTTKRRDFTESLQDMLAGGHQMSLAEISRFEPPHTATLGDWATAEPGAQIIGSHILETRRMARTAKPVKRDRVEPL